MVVGAVLMIVPLFGCGGGGDRQLRIGMMPKLVGISYFDATHRGAKEAAQELGVEIVYDGPTEDNAEEQVKMMNGWVAQGLDVIAVAPVDPELISETIRQAQQDGVKVLTWDTDANPDKSKRSVFVNQAPNEAIAETLVRIMAEGVKARTGSVDGKYLIVSGNATAANQNTWMRLMKALIAKEYPTMQLLEDLLPGEDHSRALELTAEVLNAHRDLKGIWGITSVSLPAAAKAVQDANRSKQVYVTGLGLPSQMKDYVSSGAVEKFALWDAVDLGYLTVHVAKRLHEGSLKPGVYDMGRLKGVRIENGQAILGPPVVFDKDNLDQFEF